VLTFTNAGTASKETPMRKLIAGAAAAALMAAGIASSAQAAPISRDDPNLIQAQFAVYFYSGHRYCWYDDGWHGPGWYWCGYPGRSGYGWGGAWGWRGWRGGHPGWWYQHNGGWRDENGWWHRDRGDHGDWRWHEHWRDQGDHRGWHDHDRDWRDHDRGD